MPTYVLHLPYNWRYSELMPNFADEAKTCPIGIGSFPPETGVQSTLVITPKDAFPGSDFVLLEDTVGICDPC